MFSALFLTEYGPPRLLAGNVVAKQGVVPVGRRRQVDLPVQHDGRRTTFARKLGAPLILVCAEPKGVAPFLNAPIPQRPAPRTPVRSIGECPLPRETNHRTDQSGRGDQSFVWHRYQFPLDDKSCGDRSIRCRRISRRRGAGSRVLRTGHHWYSISDVPIAASCAEHREGPDRELA